MVATRVPTPAGSPGSEAASCSKIGVRAAMAVALRRTYISLMLEAGAPLPYVMDQVGHADSKTTLEIYAQVQKRVSRKNVHAAFDELLNGADRHTPTGRR